MNPLTWPPRRILFMGVVAAILTMTLTVGVRLMNEKVAERDAPSRDDKRTADLQAIAARVQEVYERERELPKTLDELQAKTKGRISVADPQTFEVYEYRVLEGNRFEVCARFETARSGGPEEHSAGRECFQVGAGL